MKLRIRGNSIRLRVTRGELATIAEVGRVEESVDFGASALRYVLVRDDGVPKAEASFAQGCIEVRLPASDVDQWVASESQVSIESHQPLPQGALRILVEKDFACLQPRTGEDESDMFAHPETGRSTC